MERIEGLPLPPQGQRLEAIYLEEATCYSIGGELTVLAMRGTPMTHGSTVIPSKGVCIYCGDDKAVRSKEHIVPLGLGGAHILLDASCPACRRITERFELDVLRGLWGDARVSYGSPTRRKKERKATTHIDMADADNPGKSLKVPYSEYPAGLVFYKMPKAGILLGLPRVLDTSSSWQLVVISDDDRRQAFHQKYAAKPTMKFKHVPQSFARMLAKIGYGQILTLLDPEDFRPICLPYIMGADSNLSHIVGSNLSVTEKRTEFGYVLRTKGVGSFDHLYLIAEVRLLANNDTPTYHVVVGDVVGREKVTAILERIGSGAEIAVTSLPELCLNPHNSWSPAVWPLMSD